MQIKSGISQIFLIAAMMMAGGTSFADVNPKARAKEHTPVARQHNPNVAHCGYIKPNVPPASFNKPESVLLARLIPTEQNNFATQILEGSKNTAVRMPIASLAKQMTAYLVFRAVADGKLSYDDEVSMNPAHYCLPDNNYATKQLPVGVWKFKVRDLLTLMLYQSNNSAALALADAVAGNTENFIALMNNTAKEWELKNTHYTSPHGLPPKDRTTEYTTAEDQLVVAQNTLVFESEYRRFLTEPLMAGGKIIKTGTDAGKAALNKLQAVWKTATSYKCPSLFTVFNVGSEKFFSLQLCAADGRGRFDTAIKLFHQYKERAQAWGKPPSVPIAVNTVDEFTLPPAAR
jgi:hypothetical protein